MGNSASPKASLAAFKTLIQQRDRLQAMVDRQTVEIEALQAEKTARLTAAD